MIYNLGRGYWGAVPKPFILTLPPSTSSPKVSDTDLLGEAAANVSAQAEGKIFYSRASHLNPF